MNRDALVRSVEAIPIAYPEPVDHNRTRSVCLVKITTESGLVGWGECCTYFPEATRAAAALVEGIAALVIGRSAHEIDGIYEDFKQHTWWYGTGVGIASMAISGIDIALWDVKGKLLGARVLDLLGGPVKDRLPAIASLHGTKRDIAEMAEQLASYTATGLHGAKVGFGKAGDAHLGFEHDRDVAFVRAATEAMGPGKELMVDLGVKNRWDVATAITRAKAFEEIGIGWLEEPLGHDDPEGYKALRAATGVRIGYGEREWNARGVERIVSTGTVDVIGLDPGRVEGISGFRRAADICNRHRRQANAHNFSTAIVGAASLALSWASPACHLLELQPIYGPAQRDIVDRPVWHENGYVIMPEGPGLGVTVNEDLVRSMRLDK